MLEEKWKGFILGGSSISNENELTNGEIDHKAILVGSAKEQVNLRAFEECALGSKQVEEDSVEIFSFDLGGHSMTKVAFEFPVTVEISHCCLDVFTETDAFIMFLHLMLGYYYLGAVIVHKLSSYAENFFEVNPSFKKSMASLVGIDVHIWTAPIESKLELESYFYLGSYLHEVSLSSTSLLLNYAENGRQLVFVKCSNFDFQMLVFDPGITIKEEWTSGTEIDAIFYGSVTHNFLPGFVAAVEGIKEKLKFKAFKEEKMSLEHSIIIGGIILYTSRQEKINADGKMSGTFQLTFIATGLIVQLWASMTNVNSKIKAADNIHVVEFWADLKASAVYYRL